MRFLFFLLLVINGALAAHIWLSESRGPGEDPKKREINPDAMKLVAVTDPKAAASSAARVNAAKQLAESVAQGACVELAVKPTDAPKVQQSLAELNLGDRLSERKLEEVSRWWVFVPAGPRAAQDTLVASLKRQGIKDISLQADNAISLGVFSSEEAAAKQLAEVQGKGARSAQKAPRSTQVKEQLFIVREPDTNLVARLTLLSAELAGSNLKAATCPTSAAAANAAKS
jgi:hypothetical protein